VVFTPPVGTSTVRSPEPTRSRAPLAVTVSVARTPWGWWLRTRSCTSSVSPTVQATPASTRVDSGSAAGTSSTVVAAMPPSGEPTKVTRYVVSTSPSGTRSTTRPRASVRIGGSQREAVSVRPVVPRP
jgi:hypothetical protein